MAYRTILVHLPDDTRARELMSLGLDFARTFDSHLIAAYVFPAYRITPPIPLPFGSDVAGQIRRAVAEDVDRTRKAFDAATANQPVVCEWRAVTSQRRDACEIVLEHARAADLVIASQADPDWDLSSILDFPERLMLGAGRPVLVLPRAGKFRMPKRITVAWNDRREAARALGDALPLLKTADDVTIVTIEEDAPREGQLPDTEIAAALGRHGIKARLVSDVRGHRAVGEAILQQAADHGADLLVMGAYGHSRVREFVFGGATRHILNDMTLPVMFSN
jgi:nucleotide-binding universal stress UspA family protein